MVDAIYLDANSTTPTDPSVADAIRPWLEGTVGNPDSPHLFGRNAESHLRQARRRLAESLGCRVTDLVLTSGATEANNLAVTIGQVRGSHVLAGATEHPSVLRPLESLAAEGLVELELIPVTPEGVVEPRALSALLRPDTSLVSVMLANNETGVISPVRELAELAHDTGALFHTDAVQALGRVPVHFEQLGVDLMSISAHKAYGLPGVGALAANAESRRSLRPLFLGGGQEGGMRSGTSNVMGAVALARTAELAASRVTEDAARMTALRDQLERLLSQAEGLRFNGAGGSRLPSSTSVTLPGISADAVLAQCPELALSTGSACSTGSPKTSHVLEAMGLSAEEAESTFRVGLTRLTTENEIERAGRLLVETIERVRGLVHA